jgi:3-oxoacyl-[acyl-carrier-protein] synthase II
VEGIGGKLNNGNLNRVVVTGIGAVTPLGLDMKTTWEGLIAGRSGIANITLFDPALMATKFAGEAKGFDPTLYMGKKEARRMDRFAQLGVAAARQAIEDGGIKVDESNQSDIAVVVGSGIGGLTTLYQEAKVLVEQGPDRVSPFLAPMMISDMAAAQVSIILGIKGLNLCTTSACSSSADAIGVAFELIRRGDAEAALAGGAEAIINPLGITAFNALKAISTRNDAPQKASRPFDAERDGFVISEGACILVMESLARAQSRGANIIAEMISYGATADAFHMTQPDENGDGAARAMALALKKGGLRAQDIDYINAHGTSTLMNDRTETIAIKKVFGERAYKIPVSSTKSMTGHLIGGAGAIEAAICILTIMNGIIPPTINLEHPDPDCDLDYVPNVARKATVNTTLSNSFGFGGHNSVLIFRRYPWS